MADPSAVRLPESDEEPAAPAPQPETEPGGGWGDVGAAGSAATPVGAVEGAVAAREDRVAKLDGGDPAVAVAAASVEQPEPEPEPQAEEKQQAKAKSEDASIIDGDKFFAEMPIPDWAKDLCRKKGYSQPTTIQGMVIDHIFSNSSDTRYHILGQAPTGSGKTLCFVLALLRPVYEALQGSIATIEQIAASGTMAVCVMPTMELAIQLKNYFEEFEGLFASSDGTAPLPTDRISIRMAVNTKNKSDSRAQAKEKQNVAPCRENIVIGTAGTIMSWDKKKVFDFKNVQSFVLDEADALLDKKMDQQTLTIKTSIDKAVGKGAYNMVRGRAAVHC